MVRRTTNSHMQVERLVQTLPALLISGAMAEHPKLPVLSFLRVCLLSLCFPYLGWRNYPTRHTWSKGVDYQATRWVVKPRLTGTPPTSL